MTGSSSLPPVFQISRLLTSSPLPPTQQCPVSHQQNKGPTCPCRRSSLTAVYTPVLLMGLLQAQHGRPVLGHHPVLVQPINLSCLLVQPHISSQQHSLSLPHCQH